MSRKRVLSIERVLLSLILVMQFVIAWGLFRNVPRGEGDDAVEPEEAPGMESSARFEAAGDARDLSHSMLPMSFPQSEMFGEIDSMFADALKDMARLRSAMHIDEGWDALSASPTMDMRDEDGNYLVSFSIPGARPADIEVSLDGRVLTVQALAPVRGPHHTHLQQFERRILLPGPVGGTDDARAFITNGVLTVRVPKGSDMSLPRGSLRLF